MCSKFHLPSILRGTMRYQGRQQCWRGVTVERSILHDEARLVHDPWNSTDGDEWGPCFKNEPQNHPIQLLSPMFRFFWTLHNVRPIIWIAEDVAHPEFLTSLVLVELPTFQKESRISMWIMNTPWLTFSIFFQASFTNPRLPFGGNMGNTIWNYPSSHNHGSVENDGKTGRLQYDPFLSFSSEFSTEPWLWEKGYWLVTFFSPHQGLRPESLWIPDGIHGAGIYTYMYHKNQKSTKCSSICHTWMVWSWNIDSIFSGWSLNV